MKKLGLTIIILVIAITLTAGYFGLITPLSNAMGTNKPKDLKVTYTSQDLTDANSQTKVSFDNLTDTSASQSLQYIGSHPAEINFTSSQLTAMANNKRWRYDPLSNVQVKINTDGSAEASGLIDFTTAVSYVKALGVSSSDIDAALAKYPLPKTSFPFYVKLTGNVQNNQISTNIQKLELGRIPVPANIVNQYLQPAIDFVESRYLNSSIKIETLENRAGQAYFKGELPNVEAVVAR
jgi:hypothetical protein